MASINAMVRHKGRVELPIAQLREFNQRLRAVADTCDGNLDLAEAKGIESLAVTHFPTGEDGVESIAKFVGAVYAAAAEAMLKHSFPQGVKTSGPKKSGKG